MPVLRPKKKILFFEDFEELQGAEMKPFVAIQNEAADKPELPEIQAPAATAAPGNGLLGYWRKLKSKLGIAPQQ
ncbi:MAG: hypothetical protein KDC66_08740 [Phaeodactylibacter sp.]|nr:hypothetical protein [Phaeodactylibacter sp.]MCB9272704.1 hypothetical protein [Lewinellaceae bacterium]